MVASSAAARPPRFRLHAEEAGWRPGSPPRLLSAGLGCWIPAARFVCLRAQPGGTTGCVLALDRREDAWTDDECALVSAGAGDLHGARDIPAAAICFGVPEQSSAILLLSLTVTTPVEAMPGRYKAPLEVRCGGRIEPLGLLLEVLPPT